eukprot:TRINITY_DN4270_c0_g1_i1.p1 TRINITY_DN4270_c0_g1~~TRINITY_DN4270_c0_g1_i1.p1  ORF type:complete len:159 (+),score=60.86 TRINITY_DN4270_c0_g1_i1:3-479(+)
MMPPFLSYQYVCAGALALFMLMLGMAFLILIIADVATACGLSECNYGQQFVIPTWLVYVFASVCFILGGIVLALGVRSFTRFWKLRQKIMREIRSEKEALKSTAAIASPDDPEAPPVRPREDKKKKKKKKPKKKDEDEDADLKQLNQDLDYESDDDVY